MYFVKAMVCEADSIDEAEIKFAAGCVFHTQTHTLEGQLTERRCESALAITGKGLSDKIKKKVQ